MQIEKGLKYIKYFILIITLSILGILFVGNRYVKADSNYYEEILKAFKENSIEYKKTQLELQKNILAKDDYQRLLDKCQKNINATGDPATIEDLTKQYEDYLLQQNISTYYVENGEKWVDENNRIQIYNFLSDYLQIPVLNEKIKYSKTIIKELNGTLKIVKAQNKLGYATKLNVDDIQTKIETEKANLTTTEGELKLLQLQLCNKLGKTSIESFTLNKVVGIKKQEEYVENYKNNNNTLLYTEAQIKAYTTYKENMLAKGETYTKYANKADIEKQLLDLQKQKYTSELPIKIAESLISYQNESSQLVAKDKEISNVALKIKNTQTLYKKGKAKKIDVTKLMTEEAKLNYEKVEILYKLNTAYFKLFYNIES